MLGHFSFTAPTLSKTFHEFEIEMNVPNTKTESTELSSNHSIHSAGIEYNMIQSNFSFIASTLRR